ncbi:hypothetical protein AB205_0135180 [Aquarana catesbeiana]|uniref:Uncharacterized protein n=1 Tax=Aquarana catesbeiana TaxID=8400 RepID=A0A2G9RC87_AQUCT|nr:hypothetical protein AB205_0135180 [Aquarana catesbeiana]
MFVPLLKECSQTRVFPNYWHPLIRSEASLKWPLHTSLACRGHLILKEAYSPLFNMVVFKTVYQMSLMSVKEMKICAFIYEMRESSADFIIQSCAS